MKLNTSGVTPRCRRFAALTASADIAAVVGRSRDSVFGHVGSIDGKQAMIFLSASKSGCTA